MVVNSSGGGGGSTLTIFLIPKEPLLKAVANVDEHASEYHGDPPCSVAELMDSV